MGPEPGAGAGASITALGDVMSRWPGAAAGLDPPLNNPGLHPGTPGLVVTQDRSSMEEEEEQRAWTCSPNKGGGGSSDWDSS